jgi:hypothetical protein
MVFAVLGSLRAVCETLPQLNREEWIVSVWEAIRVGIAQLGSIANSIVIGYVLGCVPAAYVTARAWGVNILEVGTRNPGAANVFRSVNPIAGILVVVADTGKGFLTVSSLIPWTRQ